MKDRLDITNDVSKGLAERDQRIAELEKQLRNAKAASFGQPPVRNMVSFVGGPWHGQDRVMDPIEAARDTYQVAIYDPLPLFAGGMYYQAPPNQEQVHIGTYQLVRFPVAFMPESYIVGVWRGAS